MAWRAAAGAASQVSRPSLHKSLSPVVGGRRRGNASFDSAARCLRLFALRQGAALMLRRGRHHQASRPTGRTRHRGVLFENCTQRLIATGLCIHFILRKECEGVVARLCSSSPKSHMSSVIGVPKLLALGIYGARGDMPGRYFA